MSKKKKKPHIYWSIERSEWLYRNGIQLGGKISKFCRYLDEHSNPLNPNKVK